MKFITFLVLFSALLSGCSSNVKLSGHNVSNVDSSINIDKSAAIAVLPNKAGDPLTNKRYIPYIINALKERGFANVSESPNDLDYQLVVNFTSEAKIESTQVPVFNNERNLPYTICHRNPSSDTRTCITRYRNFMEPIVSGYKTVESPTNVYTFHYTLADQQNKLLLDSTNTVVHANCSKWKMFEFLAKDAIARANFNNPVDTPYAVEMKPDYSCE
ncbi:hypothetical protein HGG82_07105 [Marinomonas sp. M1K-6]|uniref:Lipoprotein n=1 Tax=Marinomonas profundi TaxID=2726122 RepID=A0A847R4I7_9GAMM|nr:hypothetical protein [Marinomonas profundi]NLQ17393.1 hypothetical protein [Marinomonas profundi]UDV01919.1 hypothetical protein J8N69_09885 [Marinomonas profundi]